MHAREGMLEMRVLVIDDAPDIVAPLVDSLRILNHQAESETNPKQAIEAIEQYDPDCIILDLSWGPSNADRSGIEILKKIRQRWSKEKKSVFILTGMGTAVDYKPAKDAGADGFFTKPYDLADIVQTMSRIVNGKIRVTEKPELLKTVWEPYQIVGQSRVIIKMLDEIHEAAEAGDDFMLQGEVGVGKTYAVDYYRQVINKGLGKPFVDINLSGIRQEDMLSELFGVAGDAFTGVKGRESRIKKADGGVVFLDEVGVLKQNAQKELLQLFDKKRIMPLGRGAESTPVNVTILTATHYDLYEGVNAGTIEMAFYSRVNKKVIKVPALRERLEDLPLLIDYFIRGYNHVHKQQKCIYEVDSKVVDFLQTLSWPCNVRQLQQCIEEGAAKSKDGTIILRDIQDFVVRQKILPLKKFKNDEKENNLDLTYQQFKIKVLQKMEKDYLEYHLEKHHWKIQETAESLGFKNYQRLTELMNKHGIEKPKK